jgi:hypothetical protein
VLQKKTQTNTTFLAKMDSEFAGSLPSTLSCSRRPLRSVVEIRPRSEKRITEDIRAADSFSSCKSAVSFFSSSSTWALPKPYINQRSTRSRVNAASLPWPLVCEGRANIANCVVYEGSRPKEKEGAISELGSGHQATASVPRKDGSKSMSRR